MSGGLGKVSNILRKVSDCLRNMSVRVGKGLYGLQKVSDCVKKLSDGL